MLIKIQLTLLMLLSSQLVSANVEKLPLISVYAIARGDLLPAISIKVNRLLLNEWLDFEQTILKEPLQMEMPTEQLPMEELPAIVNQVNHQTLASL